MSGKRVRGREVSTTLSSHKLREVLPTMRVCINGEERVALVDCGCSKSIVTRQICQFYRKQETPILTADGKSFVSCGMGSITLQIANKDPMQLEVLVVDNELLGFDLFLGMDIIKALGGVCIDDQGKANLVEVASALSTTMELEEPDFHAKFDRSSNSWTVSWKWAGDQPPARLCNTIPEYNVPASARAEYDEELRNWIANEWLVPYPEEELGPPKGLIPLMAVIQHNKQKVRPVLDYRELNAHVDAFTAHADICAQKLREWRREGDEVSVLDLRKAYLQIRVHRSLWPYQTVLIRGRRYCLTRMGFGLNVAPSIMRTIVDAVLSRDDRTRQATSAYIDDVYVNENKVPATEIKRHLSNFGLDSKDPERLKDGARVLGLNVWGERNTLYWKRGNEIPDMPHIITRRSVFSLCGKLVGHLPIGGWLRIAVAFIKRRVTEISTKWDEEVNDDPLKVMIAELLARVRQEDPACGEWCVDGCDLNVWVDASSLATGVLLERNGIVVEDACWLRPEKDPQHINLAELDAIIKGINLALLWKARVLHLFTDSACVHKWVNDTLTGKARVRTKAASEMLIRRRLSTITQLVEEYGLRLGITLVRSNHNRADKLTRVPQRWLEVVKKNVEPMQPSCIAAASPIEPDEIMAVHRQSGHPGVRRTFYFVKRVDPTVSKSAVRSVVRECQECQSIDPSPVHWPKGELSVKETWCRVGMDITHHNGEHYLTLIDCGPSRFTIWRRLHRQDAVSVANQLRAVFFERGPPAEVLTDNDTAFRSQSFKNFLDEWGVGLHFRCAYVPSGNGIVERCHRSIKRIAARKECSISEAVYWYNITPKDNTSQSSAPANMIYRYLTRVKGIDEVPSTTRKQSQTRYKVGDKVWVKDPRARCTTKYKTGSVTEVTSPQSIVVDGMPRHVKDLRPVVRPSHETCEPDALSSSESERYIFIDAPIELEAQTSETESLSSSSDEDSAPAPVPVPIPLRRSARRTRPPPHCHLCDDGNIRGECSEQAGNISTGHHVGQISTSNNNDLP